MSVTVETNSKKSFNTGSKLIKAEAAYGAVVDGTGCLFTYPQNERDRRESNTTLKISENQAAVIAAMDAAYAGVAITLPVHQDDDTSVAAVDTVFDVADIIWGTAYTPDAANKSWIWIHEGAFKVKKHLVDYTLAEVIALAAL